MRDLNILIGPNGAGKSNFIKFFRLLNELVEKRLQAWVQKRGGADRLFTFGIKETPQIFASLLFRHNSYTYEFTLEPTDNGGFIFVNETVTLLNEALNENIEPQKVVLGSGQTESNLTNNSKLEDYGIKSLFKLKVFHFHDTNETAGVMRYGSVDDVSYLRTDASNLAAYLYWMKNYHPNHYQKICKIVRLAIPFFDDFVLEPQVINGGNQQIRLLWRQKNSDYPLWPTQLSDGSIRFICLATALLQPHPPSTLIIDEPELGLHPYAITLLGSLIRSVSKQTQLIISTQSVTLLNEFKLEDLIVVEREEGCSVFRRLTASEFEVWLEDYTVGELWQKNVLGGRP